MWPYTDEEWELISNPKSATKQHRNIIRVDLTVNSCYIYYITPQLCGYTYTKETLMKKLLSTVAIMASLTVPAFAEDISIDMLNKRDDGAKMVYSQDIARIDVGDTITWLPKSKGHNVEFIAGPDGWEAPKKSKNGKEVAITFDTPGVYLYQCTPHATMGMIALVVVGDDTSNLDAIANMKLRGKSKKKMKSILADF